MANYHSIVHNYGKPQSNFNQELALQALSYKQGKYDANAAKIQETLNNYGNIELARPEDREYLYERLNGLVNNINNLGSADLSSTNVTSGIMGHISKALDENVVKQIGNTQKIKQYQTTVQEARKSKNGDYSDVNYQVGLMKAGYSEYMNGTTNELGALTYTPHVDVSGELTKKLKDIVTIKGGKQVIQIRDVDGKLSGVPGTIIEREIDGMTETELQTIIPTLLDEKMRAQMNVNGYYRYGGSKKTAVQSIAPQYEADMEQMNIDLTNQKTILESSDSDEATKAKAKQSITALEAQRDNRQKTYNRLTEGDAGFIGGYLEEQNLIGTMSKALAARASEKYLSDNAYFENLKIEAKRRDAEMKAGVSGSGIPDITSAPIATELLQDVDVYNRIKEEGKKLGEDYYNTSNALYNQLDQDQKSKVETLMKDVKYQGLSDKEKKVKAMMDAGVLDPNAKGILNNKSRKYTNYLEDDQRIYDEQLKSAFSSTGFYGSLVNNKNITITDENGDVVSYEEYFKTKNINSQEAYNNFINDETASKQFKQNTTANALLSAGTGSTYAASQNNLGHALNGKEAGSIDKNLLLQFERLVKLTGEDLKFTELFQVEEVDTMSGLQVAGSILAPQLAGLMKQAAGNERRPATEESIQAKKGNLKQKYNIKLNPQAQGTQAYKILEKGLQNGTWDTQKTVVGELFSKDNSVTDDETLRAALSYENFEKGYKEKVTETGLRVKGYNALYINPSTGEKNKVLLFESLRAPLAAGQSVEGEDEDNKLKALKNGVGIQLMRSPQNPDNFIVTQAGKSAVIPENVLKNYPEVVRLIDLEENANQIVRENEPPLKVENFNYKTDDVENLDYLSNRYGVNSMAFYSATKSGAKSILKQANPNLESNPDALQVFNVALNNANRFSVELKNKGGRNYIDVMFDGERISQVTDAVDRQQVEGIIDYDPQILVTMALRNIAIELKNNNTENYDKLYGRLKSK